MFDVEDVKMEAKLGTGGFGTVYQASINNNRYALKKLLVTDLDSEEVEYFLREVNLLSYVIVYYFELMRLQEIGSSKCFEVTWCYYFKKRILHVHRPLQERFIETTFEIWSDTLERKNGIYNTNCEGNGLSSHQKTSCSS